MLRKACGCFEKPRREKLFRKIRLNC